jgi:hypothetical protein
MKRSKLLLVLALAMTVPLGLVGSPASAQPSGDTTVTFTVATADLVIEVPEAADLGSAFPGERVSGQLGEVEVLDQRAALAATWTVTVTASDFVTGDGDVPELIISNSNVSYWSGPAVATTGLGTFVPGQPTADDEVSLDVPQVAFSKTSGSGVNTATWNPTLSVDIPESAVGGLYTGQVTHSVA